MRGPRGAGEQEGYDKCAGGHHGDLAPHDLGDDVELLCFGQRADRLGVRQVELIEHRLRRGDPQLLGDERDGKRQQRIEVEERFARVVAGDHEHADEHGERERARLRRAQADPEAAQHVLRRRALSPDPGAVRGDEEVDRGNHVCDRFDGARHRPALDAIDTM